MVSTVYSSIRELIKVIKELTTKDKKTDFLLYTSPNGEIKVDVFIRNENIWLTQKKIAELFEVGIPAISKHLDNIYEEGELDRDSTISILETVQNEGGREDRQGFFQAGGGKSIPRV